jgi:multidrug efflux pump subunit AcrA (membrane-fusion protein)
VVAPGAGRVVDVDKIGTSVRQGGLIAKINDGNRTTEIRTPITGRIRSLSVATGATVAAGAEVATIDPRSEQVWEALRALYLVGQLDDLPAIRAYERNVPEIPDRLREQALLTEKSILSRLK